MSNFAFMPTSLRGITDSARKAEGHIMGDPRAACFHARFALEAIVHWLYRHDAKLQMPYDQSLGALLYEPSFMGRMPEAVFQKAKVIQKQGNQAAHSQRMVRQYDAMQVVKELHHVCFWLVRTYAPEAAEQARAWDPALVPPAPSTGGVVPRERLETLETELAEKNAAALKHQQERDALDEELQSLRAQLQEIREASQAQTDTHDYREVDTRKYIIDVDLRRAGWALDQPRDLEYKVAGMPNTPGIGYVDYVLWGDDGKPLGLVEAKRTTENAEKGQQQAKLYADCLEQMHGQRPVIFYTNGYTTWIWDDRMYPPREVAGYYTKDELELLIHRRTNRQTLDATSIKNDIAGRYYQKRAIGHLFEHYALAQRKGLLVMATGTGKTRTAIALVDALQRGGWAKRVLFLADRISLCNQACKAFKEHLPSSSPVNLVTEKNTESRVYVSTYGTMMGLINDGRSTGDEVRFGVGHFDLIIIDEAHRSVYKKYGAIFRYFDSLLMGLTATPREEIDKNTYNLFDIEDGVPTDAYELTTAVRDEFLVPPKVQQVDLKFPREGIDYDALSEEEKARWEELDWGEDTQGEGIPDHVNAQAINNWLFNENTVDLVLKHLMVNGHKVNGGDRLAKTIIFARNHDHAVFIEKRFNHHYPHYKGHFARVIDNYATYAQSLIDDFSIKENAPHIAISVDMLDTGIDIPEVANLVFFKPVYSKIKFWQMIGRGTRLCPDLFGPGEDKQDFRVFDFCFNFDFFKENPDGITGSDSAPLGTRLFRARVELLGHIARMPELDADGVVGQAVTATLRAEVASMNRDNFIVRERLELVERFQKPEAWESLNEDDREALSQYLAELPSELPADDIEARMFDLTALRMQLAHAQGDAGAFETSRKKVIDIAQMLEEKITVPAVKQQIEYIASIQQDEFWLDLSLEALEELRLRIRELVQFLDRKKRKIVYTDFQDEVVGVRDAEGIDMPKMTGPQYEKKVREYLKNHAMDIAIHRLRNNEPLTQTDLDGLQAALVQIGSDEGDLLLSNLLARNGAPSIPHFVRTLVGLDRKAANAAFAELLSKHTLTSKQMQFIEMIIDQLTSRGVMPAAALYEPPFSNLDARGPDAVFDGPNGVIDGVFTALEAAHQGLRVITN
jgi:type I restriction enzyme R subunit